MVNVPLLNYELTFLWRKILKWFIWLNSKYLIFKLVQVKLSPSDQIILLIRAKSNPVDHSIDENTVLLCARHFTEGWEDNLSPTSKDKVGDTSVN